MADLIALTTKPHRPYRERYAGIIRQTCRNNGLNPIRDRKLIEQLMPQIIALANVEIIDHGDGNYGVRGIWTTAGPAM
jgi:hypothetical protein